MRIIATVRCAACRGERRRTSDRLGTVIGDRDGFVAFEADDRTVRRAIRRLHGIERSLPSSSTFLVHPRIPALQVPEHLDVWCRRHGPGRVSSSDVLSARGTIYLNHVGPTA